MNSIRQYLDIDIRTKILNINDFEIFDDEYKKEYLELYEYLTSNDIDEFAFTSLNIFTRHKLIKNPNIIYFISKNKTQIIYNDEYYNDKITKFYKPLKTHFNYLIPQSCKHFINYNKIADFNIEDLTKIKDILKISSNVRFIIYQLLTKEETQFRYKMLLIIKQVCLYSILNMMKIIRYFDFANNISYDVFYEKKLEKYYIKDVNYISEPRILSSNIEIPNKFIDLPYILLFIGEPEYINKPINHEELDM